MEVDVILNGPSLKKDLANVSLSQNKLMCNHFLESGFSETLVPTYYLFQDRYFVDAHVRSTFITRRNKTFDIIANTEPKFHLVVPGANYFKDLVTHCPALGQCEVSFIRSRSRFLGKDVYRIVKPKSAIMRSLVRRGILTPSLDNAVIGACLFLIRRGYKRIRLFGMSMNYLTGLKLDSQRNLVTCHQYNGYDIVDYLYKNKYDFTPQTVQGEIAKWARVFASLELLNIYARHRDCKIINCTTDTLVDVFDFE